jgi:hypothetical protein
MKILTTTAIFSLITASAMASIPVGRGEISISATASGTYDSNVLGNRTSFEDYYGTFAPRVAYIRKAGKIEADASVGVSFQRWVDHTDYNTEDLNASAALNLSKDSFTNLTGSLTAGYNESFDVNNDVNTRIRAKATTFSGNATLVTGPRTDVGITGTFSNAERTGASDQRSISGGASFHYNDFLYGTRLGLLYDYSDTSSSGDNFLGVDINQNSHQVSLDLSRPIYREIRGNVRYGYRILNRSALETTTGDTRETSNVFSAGIDGPFLPERSFPKVKTHFSISYSDAASPGINDTGSKQLSGDISASWEARETTSITLGASRGQNLSVTDLTVISSSVRASIQQKLRYNLSGTAGVSYNWNTYRGVTRRDEVLSSDAGLNYTFARTWSANANYKYTSTISDQRASEFVRHVATVGVSHTF